MYYNAGAVATYVDHWCNYVYITYFSVLEASGATEARHWLIQSRSRSFGPTIGSQLR